MCRHPPPGSSTYETYATQAQGSWGWNGYNPVLQYRGGAAKVDISIICGDPNQDPPQLDAIGELDQGITYFNLFSKCACPGACASTVPPEAGAGLTVGSILLIASLAGVVVYVSGTVTFNLVKRQARGREVMPHPDFWAGVPGLVKEGCLFTWHTVCGRGRGQYEAV